MCGALPIRPLSLTTQVALVVRDRDMAYDLLTTCLAWFDMTLASRLVDDRLDLNP